MKSNEKQKNKSRKQTNERTQHARMGPQSSSNIVSHSVCAFLSSAEGIFGMRSRVLSLLLIHTPRNPRREPNADVPT